MRALHPPDMLALLMVAPSKIINTKQITQHSTTQQETPNTKHRTMPIDEVTISTILRTKRPEWQVHVQNTSRTIQVYDDKAT
jgi:hypothetical protein